MKLQNICEITDFYCRFFIPNSRNYSYLQSDSQIRISGYRLPGSRTHSNLWLELYARSCHGKQFRGRTRDLRSRFHHSLCSYHSHSLHPLHPHSRQLGTYRPATTCRCIQFLPGIYPDSSCHPYGSHGMDMGLLAIVKKHNAYYVAGHVMAGLACICSSLVALVATIVRQIRNNYTKAERKRWPALVLIMGQHQHSLGTSGLGQQQSGTLLHRIYYDRPGTGMLQHFQQSHPACRHLAEHFQAGQPHPADSGLHGPGLSVSLRLSV